MARSVPVMLCLLGACAHPPAAVEQSDERHHAEPERAEPKRAEPEVAEPESFTPATRGSGSCEVTVVALLEAESYRGPGPITPMIADSLDADPEYAEFYNSASHGDLHIQCHYRVELLGQAYRWRQVVSNTFEEHTPKVCNGLAAVVAEDIIRTTHDCTDLHRGAYYGYVLEPLD